MLERGQAPSVQPPVRTESRRVRERPAGPGRSAPARSTRSQLPPLIGVLALIVLCLLVYIVGRAVDVPFTVDEAGSYELFHGVMYTVNSANNQWLNTELMQFGQTLFGQAEWALRLPNVLAFLLYGGASLWLVRSLRSSAARLLCFALLFTDPFLLEFFGLARGYGLSVAFSCAAMVVLLTYPMNGSGARAVIRLELVGLLAGIGFYANFSVLNYLLALLGLTVADTVIRSAQGRITMTRRHWLALIAVGCALAGGLLPGVLQVVHLNATLQLYYGGLRGFVPDTVGSLVMTWGYKYVYVQGTPLPGWALNVAWVVTAVGVITLIYVLAQSVRGRRWGLMQLTALLLAIAVLAVVVEHVVLGTIWPIDRTALSYVFVFAALMGLVVDDIDCRLRWGPARRMLVSAGAVVLCLGLVNVVRAANLTQALTWPADVSSRAASYALMALERERGEPPPPMTVAVVWPRENALNYYRIRFHLNWMHIVWLENHPTPIRFPSSAFVDEVPPGFPVKLQRRASRIARLGPDGTELWENPIRLEARAP